MAYCIKVRKKNAEKAKRYLVRNGLFNRGYKVFSRKSFIYFPILHVPNGKDAKVLKTLGSVEVEDFERSSIKSYRDLLTEEFRDIEKLPTGYDLLGNIAVIDAEAGDAKKIARIVIRVNKGVETVVRKAGAVTGLYRTRRYLHVLGKKNFISRYKENNCLFVFDIRKVFFSTRLAYERQRISKLVKKDEQVIVMFAGVGPFAIEIAKAMPSSKVIAMELNKHAYEAMLNNIKLNHVENVIPELGDVNRLAARHKNFADRIVMPLPKDSYNFLGAVLAVAKPNCIVHYYTFGSKESAFEDSEKRLREFFNMHGVKIRIVGKRVVRPYSAKEVEIVMDFKLVK